MTRIAFTIILNGAHHLRHNDFINKMPKLFDYWVVIEGAALANGSTAWCKDVPAYHKNGQSIDDTRDLLEEACLENDNMCAVLAMRPWESKDAMVRKAIDVIKSEVGVPDKAYLWQTDSDECWTEEALCEAESGLDRLKADCGCFHANYFLGPDIQAVGEWGAGNAPDDPLRNAYRRLWRWKGQQFFTHESPVLEGGNGKEVLLAPKFEHFAYLFERDVKFKNDYYSGHEGIHERWLRLQKETVFPQPISYLITGPWGKTASSIIRNTSI